MVRPQESLYMKKPVADKLWLAIFAVAIGVLVSFGYISYLAYKMTAGTKYFVFSYIIISPVFVAAILLILLVISGKKGFYKEMEQYRVR